MTEVNRSAIKSWSQIESTAIYKSNKSGSWKQSTPSQMYINLVHPPLIIYIIYTCAKEMNTTNQWVKSLNTPDFVWQRLKPHTGSQPSSFLSRLSQRVEERNQAGNDSTRHPLPCLELKRIGLTYFDSKLCCFWTEKKKHKHHILEGKQHCPKQHRCPAVKAGFNTDLWYCYSYQSVTQKVAISSTISVNPVLECNINEATLVSKKKQTCEFQK